MGNQFRSKKRSINLSIAEKLTSWWRGVKKVDTSRINHEFRATSAFSNNLEIVGNREVVTLKKDSTEFVDTFSIHVAHKQMNITKTFFNGGIHEFYLQCADILKECKRNGKIPVIIFVDSSQLVYCLIWNNARLFMELCNKYAVKHIYCYDPKIEAGVLFFNFYTFFNEVPKLDFLDTWYKNKEANNDKKDKTD